MVKASRGQIAQALKALDAKTQAVLLFGRDEGLIRERAQRLTEQVLGGADDPFRHIRLSEADLKDTPSRLADERAAISFTPGARLIRLDNPSDSHVPDLEAALDGPAAEAVILLVAGDLAPRSKLRKAAESRPDMLAIACYPDEGADLDALVREVLAAAGLRADPDAQTYLVAHLGGDRALSRRELEKLVLYKEGDADRTVSLAEAEACVGDGSALSLQRLAEAVTAGQPHQIDTLLERVYAAGDSPVGVLRVLQIRLQKLHLMRAHMGRGLEPKAAVAKLIPPPIWKERDGLVRDAVRWPDAKLARALAKLLEAELAAKSTGLPDKALCHRTLMEIALAVRK